MTKMMKRILTQRKMQVRALKMKHQIAGMWTNSIKWMVTVPSSKTKKTIFQKNSIKSLLSFRILIIANSVTKL